MSFRHIEGEVIVIMTRSLSIGIQSSAHSDENCQAIERRSSIIQEQFTLGGVWRDVIVITNACIQVLKSWMMFVNLRSLGPNAYWIGASKLPNTI